MPTAAFISMVTRRWSALNRQVLHLVVYALLMALKSSTKWKFNTAQVVGSQITRKLMHILGNTKKLKTCFPRTEKYRYTNQEKKSLFTLHATQKCPFTPRNGTVSGTLFIQSVSFGTRDHEFDLISSWKTYLNTITSTRSHPCPQE